jgi:hypothetical protein
MRTFAYAATMLIIVFCFSTYLVSIRVPPSTVSAPQL